MLSPREQRLLCWLRDFGLTASDVPWVNPDPEWEPLESSGLVRFGDSPDEIESSGMRRRKLYLTEKGREEIEDDTTATESTDEESRDDVLREEGQADNA